MSQPQRAQFGNLPPPRALSGVVSAVIHPVVTPYQQQNMPPQQQVPQHPDMSPQSCMFIFKLILVCQCATVCQLFY